MKLQAFLQAVEDIRREAPRYRLGGKGEDGGCDCIGLVIGAVERSGGVWSGIHGSNWWARHYTQGLSALTDASALSPGDLVFKARGPDRAGYALPQRYAEDPDKLDYYHVGVVTAVDPLAITHCTSSGSVSGVTVDASAGRWTHSARLSLLAEEAKEEAEAMTATVYAENGKPVNLRKKPSLSGALEARIPVGRVATIHERSGGWARVQVDGHTGYMMETYLRVEEDSPETWSGLAAEELADLLARLAALEERIAALEGGLG